ncbi:HDL111Cp [Eremothecium sinecaudum]|uniref:HDL111Cp n=1 Tax=Eremothecium sinecaudum TaxID=45286 RepID=A0A0X8HSK7_9SACH|nr:HDL111Cp [Eremothecium sinecaudum]AMD20633.1 HDL111Cp [Eremothecium sinecaudum]
MSELELLIEDTEVNFNHNDHIVITGDFDDWQHEKYTLKYDDFTRAYRVQLPYNGEEDLVFKFVVNGTQWLTVDCFDSITDAGGFVNNRIFCKDWLKQVKEGPKDVDNNKGMDVISAAETIESFGRSEKSGVSSRLVPEPLYSHEEAYDSSASVDEGFKGSPLEIEGAKYLVDEQKDERSEIHEDAVEDNHRERPEAITDREIQTVLKVVEEAEVSEKVKVTEIAEQDREDEEHKEREEQEDPEEPGEVEEWEESDKQEEQEEQEDPEVSVEVRELEEAEETEEAEDFEDANEAAYANKKEYVDELEEANEEEYADELEYANEVEDANEEEYADDLGYAHELEDANEEEYADYLEYAHELEDEDELEDSDELEEVENPKKLEEFEDTNETEKVNVADVESVETEDIEGVESVEAQNIEDIEDAEAVVDAESSEGSVDIEESEDAEDAEDAQGVKVEEVQYAEEVEEVEIEDVEDIEEAKKIEKIKQINEACASAVIPEVISSKLTEENLKGAETEEETEEETGEELVDCEDSYQYGYSYTYCFSEADCDASRISSESRISGDSAADNVSNDSSHSKICDLSREVLPVQQKQACVQVESIPAKPSLSLPGDYIHVDEASELSSTEGVELAQSVGSEVSDQELFHRDREEQKPKSQGIFSVIKLFKTYWKG